MSQFKKGDKIVRTGISQKFMYSEVIHGEVYTFDGYHDQKAQLILLTEWPQDTAGFEAKNFQLEAIYNTPLEKALR